MAIKEKKRQHYLVFLSLKGLFKSSMFNILFYDSTFAAKSRLQPRKFALVSGICHSGSLHSGHYTAFARDDVCGGWLHLNDKAVTRTTLKALNGPLPYV